MIFENDKNENGDDNECNDNETPSETSAKIKDNVTTLIPEVNRAK